jgi:lysophospholipase L1-like esterase
MSLDAKSRRGLWISVGLYLFALFTMALGGAKRSPMVLVIAACALLVAAVIGNITVREIRDREKLPAAQRLLVPLGLSVVGLGGGALLFSKGTNGVALFLFCGGVVTLGHFLGEWRSHEWFAPWRGLLIILLCAAGFFVGLHNATDQPMPWLLWIAAAVLLSPLGLTLLSEDVIRAKLEENQAEKREGATPMVLIAVAVIGLVLLAVGSWWLLSTRVSGFYLLLIVPLIALLVLVIASQTQADLLLIAVMAVLVVTSLPSSVPLDKTLVASSTPDPQTDEQVLVSLGDSYMSGEGAKRFYSGTNDRVDNECRRAPTAYMHLLVSREKDPVNSRLAFYACSGATGRNIVPDPTTQSSGKSPGSPQFPKEPAGAGAGQTQLTQVQHLLDAGAKISLVVVSIGGNDAGFGDLALACLAPRDCVVRGQIWLDDLSRAEREIGAAYDAVQQVVTDDVPVLVVPYPQPINAIKNKKNCSYSLLEKQENKFLNGFVVELNKVVRKEADGHNFHYLAAMENAFGPQHMRICDPKSKGEKLGVNFIALDAVNGLVEQIVNPTSWVHGSLHPNQAGHEAMAKVVDQWMKDNPSPTARSKPSVVAEYNVRTLDQIMEGTYKRDYCRKTGSKVTRCDLSATDWTITEIARFGFEVIWPLLVVVLGAWLMCLAFLTKTRKFWHSMFASLGEKLGLSTPTPKEPS